MKAVRFAGKGIVETYDKPVPDIGENDILVKVAYCGLCGSENRVVRSGFDNCVPGHEMTGTVTRLGCKTKKFEIGQNVLVYLSNYCGKCEACLTENTSQCENRRGLIGWGFDGGYEEYVRVPDHMVFPLDHIPLDLGVLALDTIGTAFHGLRQVDIHKDDSVLVIGCGPIGLGCVSILKDHYGVEELYAADVSDYHLTMARNMSAKPIKVDPVDTIGSIEKAVGKKRFNRVIEVCGIDATIAASAHFVHAGGKIAMIGEPEKALTLVRTSEWILKDFALVNSWYFPINEIAENIDFIRANQEDVEKLITHTFTLDEMTRAYELFQLGLTGKVLIRVS